MCQHLPAVRGSGRGPELAHVFRQHVHELPELSGEQARAAHDIAICRTEALGGYVEQCEECGHRQAFYNSCWNRHCPKCQRLKQAEWLEARMRELLPTQYCHVIFTVPRTLHPLFRAAPATCYSLLFDAVAETVKDVAINPRFLGANVGFMAILHTWSQTLRLHPHVHCVIPAGGIAPDRSGWIPCKSRFFLPFPALSKVMAGKLREKLLSAIESGSIPIDRCEGVGLANKAGREGCNIQCKPPFDTPEHVYRYLCRYTHRIAISNARILDLSDGEVTFSYKDRADGDRKKTMKLPAAAFLKRFLQHVLPRSFVRIRYYGFLANSAKRTMIPLCLDLLGAEEVPLREEDADESWQERLKRLTGRDATRCPSCGVGRLVRVESLPRGPPPFSKDVE